MIDYRYELGDGSWVAFAAAEQLLAVEASSQSDIEGFWSSLPLGLRGVLDVLTSRGLSATPSFALLSWGSAGELRAIVRGPVRLTVTVDGRDQVLDGTGVSTWTEMIFAADATFDLDLGGQPDAVSLPLVSAAVSASRVTSARTGTAAPALASPSAAVAPDTVSEATVVDASDDAQDQQADALPEAEEPSDDGYDHLFGVTMHRNIADAAVETGQPVEDAAEPGAESTDSAETDATVGDHDGMTIMGGDLRRLRESRRSVATSGAPSASSTVTLSLALSTGAIEPLDQTLIVGRSPSASKVSGGALPRLITIPGDKDISRNHAQFAVEGGTVVVTDLHSRNGTQIVMPGRAPQQLRQGEPTTVIVGTMIDLGGGVTMTVREGE